MSAAFPDSECASVAAIGLELCGTRLARRGDADSQHAPFEYIDSLLGLPLVRSGRIDVIDDLRSFRRIAGELHFHQELRTGIYRRLAAVCDAFHPFDR